MDWSSRWIFAWWFVDLGRVNPNYSSHSSDFDVSWLIGWTATKYRAYTLESSLFLVNFRRGVLLKKKTLQEHLSVQVDLNWGIKKGFILLWLTEQLIKMESEIDNTDFLISPTTHLFPLASQLGCRGVSTMINFELKIWNNAKYYQSIQSYMSILN